MNNLKDFREEEVVRMVAEGKAGTADLTDSGICPTCFNKKHNGVLFGDDTDKMIYEDEELECFLVGNPRSEGHVAISTKKHYKDMMDIDDETCKKVYVLAKRVMIILREVYKSESVYLCTMCDGPMNHFHVQLIPRYDFEKRGSKNFVKPRFDYVEDKEKLLALRKKLDYKVEK